MNKLLFLLLLLIPGQALASYYHFTFTQDLCESIEGWDIYAAPLPGNPDFLSASWVGFITNNPTRCTSPAIEAEVNVTTTGSQRFWLVAVKGELMSDPSNFSDAILPSTTTTTSTTTTSTLSQGTPTCKADESACEKPIAIYCLCGGVDPCLPGEWCAGAVKLCPVTKTACLALLPPPTTTTTLPPPPHILQVTPIT